MLPQCLSLNCCKPSKQSSLAHPLHDQSNQHLPHQELPKLYVRNYEFLVPTGSTQFLLVVRFSPSWSISPLDFWKVWVLWRKYSSMTVRTKIGLGLDEYIGENELGWDDSEFSVFTLTPEDVEGKPLYNRFVKTDRMKAVPPPLSGNYIPLSDPTDLDESQMTYGPKQTYTSDSEPKTIDLDSCDTQL
ncbi:hypothetical protein Tco_1113684 [Tanacetum coccineum]|uniref:Uncharacterized protein n=1 Tax=Tanacetum coccineum TaxID=301880 RepID=A0ABQ5ITF7_9ASTR